jgi:RimJ/RimL family protein N-acetyltransferase
MRILADPERLLGDLAVACEAPIRFWLPPRLTIERSGAWLRDWDGDDAPALEPVCGDPDVCRFSSVPWRYSPQAARDWVARQAAHRARGEAIAMVIAAGPRSAQPLGTVNLTRFHDGGRAAALGYWLLPEARGGGHGTRAAAALCGYGFSEFGLGLERIELAILPENHASRRLAERLGARHEGLRRASHVAEGRAWDMEIYILEEAP